MLHLTITRKGGITCYACKDESDNDACNQEEAEICSHNKQVRCFTFYNNKEELLVIPARMNQTTMLVIRRRLKYAHTINR